MCRAEWFSGKILQNAAKEQSPTAAQEEGEGSPGGHAPRPQAPQQSSECGEGDERKGKVVGVSLLLAGKQLFFLDGLVLLMGGVGVVLLVPKSLTPLSSYLPLTQCLLSTSLSLAVTSVSYPHKKPQVGGAPGQVLGN